MDFSLFNNFIQGIYIFHLENSDDNASLRIIYGNSNALQLTGMSLQSVQGQLIDEIFPAMRAKGASEIFADVVRHNSPVEFDDFHYEFHHGNSGIFNVKAVPLEGSLVAVLFEDVYQEVMLKEELNRKNFLLAETENLALIGGWEFDVAAGDFTWTAELSRISEVPRGFIPSKKRFISFFHSDSQEKIISALEDAERGKNFDLEVEYVTYEHHTRWVRVIGKSVTINDEVIRVHGVFQDITVRVEYEQELIDARRKAEEANISKSVFLSNMSHEIRTPLNGVMGLLQLLKEKNLSPDKRKLADLIYHSANELLSVVNDILEFSKIESNRVELHPVPFSIRDIVTSTMHLFRVNAESKGLSLYCNISDDVPNMVIGDKTRIRQVISNIIGNAVKFTLQGSVTVNLQDAMSSDGNHYITITVKDTGIGIPQEKQKLMFERFSQVENSYTRSFSGSGLGLAISKRLIELMKGSISFSSREREGTTFTMEIPMERFSSIDAKRITPSRQQISVVPEGVRVLIAEDDKTSQHVATSFLKSMKTKSTMVENGEEAVKSFKTDQWDIVLLDIQMPVMDGLSAMKEMRIYEKEEGLARTPMVAVTAFSMKEETETFLKSGFDQCITKPYKKNELAQVLAYYISNK